MEKMEKQHNFWIHEMMIKLKKNKPHSKQHCESESQRNFQSHYHWQENVTPFSASVLYYKELLYTINYLYEVHIK